MKQFSHLHPFLHFRNQIDTNHIHKEHSEAIVPEDLISIPLIWFHLQWEKQLW